MRLSCPWCFGIASVDAEPIVWRRERHCAGNGQEWPGHRMFEDFSARSEFSPDGQMDTANFCG